MTTYYPSQCTLARGIDLFAGSDTLTWDGIGGTSLVTSWLFPLALFVPGSGIEQDWAYEPGCSWVLSCVLGMDIDPAVGVDYTDVSLTDTAFTVELRDGASAVSDYEVLIYSQTGGDVRTVRTRRGHNAAITYGDIPDFNPGQPAAGRKITIKLRTDQAFLGSSPNNNFVNMRPYHGTNTGYGAFDNLLTLGQNPGGIYRAYGISTPNTRPPLAASHKQTKRGRFF